jgi:hypothetical protein
MHLRCWAAAKLGHEIEVVRFATRVVDLTAAGTQVLSHGRVRERQTGAGRAAGRQRTKVAVGV